MKIKIYSAFYKPFIMGGHCHHYAGTKVKIHGFNKIQLGYGLVAYLVHNAHRNCWHAVESESGAITGTAHQRRQVMKQVLHDVATGDPTVMMEQIERAKEIAKEVAMISPEEFFKSFKHFNIA